MYLALAQAVGVENRNFPRVLNRVCRGPGILLWHFQGLEGPGKRLLAQESSGNLLNSSKK